MGASRKCVISLTPNPSPRREGNRMLCARLTLRTFFQDRKIQKKERKVGQKVQYLTFFSYIRRTITKTKQL